MRHRPPVFVGVDAGATKTRLIAADGRGRLMADLVGPGISATMQGPARAAVQIARMLSAIPGPGDISGIAVGIAGAWSVPVSRRIARFLKRDLPSAGILVANDALAVLLAADPGESVLLLALGTGAVLAGRAGTRQSAAVRVDGWGPLGGDIGSGYWIGRRALQSSLAAYDGRERATPLARAVLSQLNLRSPAESISSLYADPDIHSRIAALAPLVIRAARRDDPAARRIIREASRGLVRTVRAGLIKMPPGRVRLMLAGGPVRDNPELLSGIRAYARKNPRRLSLDHSPRIPAVECLRLAALRFGKGVAEERLSRLFSRLSSSSPRFLRRPARPKLPVTEAANPDTAGFSRLPLDVQLALLNAEDAKVAPAIARILPRVAEAIRGIAARMMKGGRLIYAGAGTSGRLGVLDAAEAPPTFGVGPGVVIGVMAGGVRALRRSVEGAEDDSRAGARQMRQLRLSARDSVIGLSASGNAPYVLGALAEARRRKALRVAITCNPRSPLARAGAITLPALVGPEAIAGSTRLKAGTAQKLLLNMISTCVMARLGRIRGSAMIRMVPRNRKLKARAVRIAAEALNIPADLARRRLAKAAWDLSRVIPR